MTSVINLLKQHMIDAQARSEQSATEAQKLAEKAAILGAYEKGLAQLSSSDARGAFINQIYRAAVAPEQSSASDAFKESAAELYDAFRKQAFKATGMRTKAALVFLAKSPHIMIPLSILTTVTTAGLVEQPWPMKLAFGGAAFVDAILANFSFVVASCSKLPNALCDQFLRDTPVPIFQNAFKAMLTENFPLATNEYRASDFLKKAEDKVGFDEAMLSILSDFSRGKLNCSFDETTAESEALKKQHGKKASIFSTAFSIYAKDVAAQSPSRKTFGQILKMAFSKPQIA